MHNILEFIMYDSAIDIEKLRKSLHKQVRSERGRNRMKREREINIQSETIW